NGKPRVSEKEWRGGEDKIDRGRLGEQRRNSGKVFGREGTIGRRAQEGDSRRHSGAEVLSDPIRLFHTPNRRPATLGSGDRLSPIAAGRRRGGRQKSDPR